MPTFNHVAAVCTKILANQKDLRAALDTKDTLTRVRLLLSSLYAVRSQAQELLLDKELYASDHVTLSFLLDFVKNTQSLYLQLVKDAEDYLLTSVLSCIK